MQTGAYHFVTESKNALFTDDYLGTPDQPGARVELMDAWGRYCTGRQLLPASSTAA